MYARIFRQVRVLPVAVRLDTVGVCRVVVVVGFVWYDDGRDYDRRDYYGVWLFGRVCHS
jgi:hypothetical protein